MKSIVEQLNELSQLLNSGAITQEEFEKAKKKILDGENNQVRNSKSKKNVWIGVAVLAIVIVGVISYVVSINSNKSDFSYYDSSEEPINANGENETINVDGFIKEGSEEDFEINNPWTKHYFNDGLGKEDTSRPFISTVISGSWNLRVVYFYHSFLLSLQDKDGIIKHISEPACVVMTDPNGNSHELEITAVEDNRILIDNTDDVESLYSNFDSGKFELFVRYQMYNEQHQLTFQIDHPKSMFSKSTKRFLN